MKVSQETIENLEKVLKQSGFSEIYKSKPLDYEILGILQIQKQF
jgi:hypothetical protein